MSEAQSVIPEILSPPPPGMDGANIVLQHEVAPLLSVVTSRNREEVAVRIRVLEATALSLVQRMDLAINDQESYTVVAGLVQEAAACLRESGDFVEPVRVITYGLYQQALDLKRQLQEKLEAKLKDKKNDLLAWDRAQEAIRQENQRKLQEQQRKQEEERKLQAAASAEQAGMDEQSVEAILNAPSVAPAPIAASTYTPARNLSVRAAWCAEVTDFFALVKAVAKKKDWLPLLYAYDPDQKTSPNLNAQACSLKTALAIPGVRAVNKGSVAVRGGR
jgi:hypothetical protein